MMNPKYQALFEPFTFPCGITMKNRLALAPMTHCSSHPDGTVSEQELPYYRSRAQGLGMVITAAASVAMDGKGFSQQFGAHDDAMLPGLKILADTLRQQGALAVLQIHHGGRMSPPELVPDGKIYSASAIPAAREGVQTPLEMTEAHILQTIQAFGDATRRAIQAGFNGVELHGANTYLLQQFFSPHSNRRTDRWGGDVQQRMAFPLAVIEAVKAAIKTHASQPFIVGYRFSPEEIENPGITFEDSLLFAEVLAQQGLDYLHVSSVQFWGGSLRDKSDKTSRAVRIQEAVGHRIPVMGVGSINTPDDALNALNSGVPLLALGRELVVEPHWISKVQADEISEIRTTLRDTDQEALEIPDGLWYMILNTPGWFPVVK
jgi:2,4-dienoyl-CoA reductase-like NADH-dependent reductase (Old Yellow Enzyme family)